MYIFGTKIILKISRTLLKDQIMHWAFTWMKIFFIWLIAIAISISGLSLPQTNSTHNSILRVHVYPSRFSGPTNYINGVHRRHSRWKKRKN